MSEYKEIKLQNGGAALVSVEDYERLSEHRWFRSSAGYAYRQGWHGVQGRGGKHWTVWMHREVNGTPDDSFTDHINGVKLDNRRENLRTVNKSQNSANCPKSKRPDVTSKYKGVRFHKHSNLWMARIFCGEIEKATYHKTEEQAALDYNKMATEFFGEYAQLNVLPEGIEPSKPFKSSTTSKYHGVYWLKRERRWQAALQKSGKKILLGTFKVEEDAARAYNEGAKVHFGDEAKLNTIL